jgi:hypothetical protein
MNKNKFVMTVRGCGAAHDVENKQFPRWKSAYDAAIVIIDQFRGANADKALLTKWQGSGLTALWTGAGPNGEVRLVHIDPHHNGVPNPLNSTAGGSVQPTINPPRPPRPPSLDLVLAVCNGDIAAVQTLLDKGANPNGVDEDGDTPLSEAVRWGHRNIVQLLISEGADHNARNSDGETAMEIAVIKGDTEMVRLLQNAAKEPIKKPKPPVDVNDPHLAPLLKKLNGMVGLHLVKAHVYGKINLLRVQKMKEEAGLPVPPQNLHMIFTGNPGTGKTTVARLIAEIYKALGILSTGQLVEANAKDLVGEYTGHTSAKTTEVIESALGGVLFLDEAYALLNIAKFGQEAIETLLPALTNHVGEFMVIVAGYPEPMKKFISSNPGLQRRFPETIEFEDYLPDELTQVFLRRAKDDHVVLADGTTEKVTNVFRELYAKRGVDFGNAGVAIDLFDKAISKQSSRLAQMLSADRESLMTLHPGDIPNAGS